MGRVPDWEAAQERPITVLGAGGMLATALVDALEEVGWHYVALSEQDLDITSEGRIRVLLKGLNPRIVINAAAYTNVDGAETEVEKAFAVNGKAPDHLAAFCQSHNARLIHISTDYVFDGTKKGSYDPSDPVNPINVYGASKLEGERRIFERMEDYLIVRTSWLFGPGGHNFVTTMLKLGREKNEVNVVDDQRGSPTFTRQLAPGLLRLAELHVTGILHLTNSGSCSWYQFAREIFSIAGMTVKVHPVTTEAFPRPAKRPQNSVLDCSATYEVLGEPLPTWQEALEAYLEEIGERKS